MKKFVFILLPLLLLITGISISRYLFAGPEKIVARMLHHLSAGHFSRAANCTVEHSIGMEGKSWSSKRFYKEMFSTIQYRIIHCETEGNEAKVTVVVTMIDTGALMAEASLQSLDQPFFQPGSYRTMIKNSVRSGDAEYLLSNVSVYLHKENGRWKISLSDSGKFADAITGGMSQLIGY